MLSKEKVNPGEDVHGIPKNREHISVPLAHSKLKLKTNTTMLMTTGW